ncbi:MAG: Rhizobium phage 16-3 [Pseudomonadota bacterium]|jgi:hypothetical protein
MADITITSSSVAAAGATDVADCTAGATITAGQVVYLESSSNTVKLADADSATAEVRSPYGIALNGGASGQPIKVLRRGSVTIGATLTAGLAYYLSKTAGGICPVADIASGGYATVLGIATSTSVLKVQILESGVAV